MMEDILISFETAKLAKEKGFNIDVINYYTPEGYCTDSNGYMTERLESSNWNNGEGSYPTLSEKVSCSAPSQSLLQKWLREVHNIHIDIRINAVSRGNYFFYLSKTKTPFYTLFVSEKNSDSYEEALEIGLINALKLIK